MKETEDAVTFVVSRWEQHSANDVFSFDTTKTHYGHKYTPLPSDGLIKTVSLVADDIMKAAIGLIKMHKASHLPA